MVTVLVSGGAGYVGSHACKALARAGYQPVVYDSLEGGSAQLVRWGPLEQGSIGDAARLDAVMARHRPRALLHFAGLIAVGESVADPGRYWRVNVADSLSLLEAARRNGVEAVVFSSSAAVYGLPRAVPIAEDHPLAPINPYGWTKLAIEQVMAHCEAAYGLRGTALRYFNAAGADPGGETGECHQPETHAIPLAIAAACGGAPFRLFGTDYPTPDGTAIRDYVHVSDLADAHVAALAHLLAGGTGQRLNLGTGRGVSVREILAAVEQVAGRPVPVTEQSRRPGDPPVLVADPGRAARLLHWKPRFTAIADIVATAWAWHRRREG